MKRVLEVLIGILLFPVLVVVGLFYGTVQVYKALHSAYMTNYMHDEF